ncbi:YncE family protein [Pseudaminobacter salicylatoxidans]|uniref:YncE family protein n=1 Tax=Pseudaminobacter salicylatoxidans TaxID=93369 RepID=UPI0002E54C7D|nr:hypothetical protein [Pseudaminobacter salicylatoxidans]
MLYVENSRGGDISVIDRKTHEVVRTIPLGQDDHPDDIVASSDGKTLYLNCLKPVSGHLTMDAASDNSEILAVSIETEKILWRKQFRGQVGHMIISPDNRYLYVALYDMYYLLRLDTRTQEVAYIPVHVMGGHGVRLSPDSRRLYLGSILFGEMNVIDLETDSVIQRLYFRDPVRPFDITADEQTAYVQTSWLHGFHVVDLKDGRTRKTIALPPLPPETPEPKIWPNTVDHGLVLTPDGRRMICVATTGGYVAIYSTPELDLIGTINVGVQPNWVITDKTGEIAYVSSRISNTISVISITEGREIKRIDVGDYPQRMWITG